MYDEIVISHNRIYKLKSKIEKKTEKVTVRLKKQIDESRKRTNRKSFIDKNEMEQQIIRAK